MLKADIIACLLAAGRNADEPDPFRLIPEPNLPELADSGAASVDLRLGTWFVTLRQGRMSHLSLHEKPLVKELYLPFGKKYYLHPRCFVLGATLEWLRFPRNLAGYVIGKSSWGRRGLVIATATGIHPGFAGCLTLEIANLGEAPLEILPGMTICQLCLHWAKSNSAKTDQSSFVCKRRPVVGEIKPDLIARSLANAYNRESRNVTA